MSNAQTVQNFNLLANDLNRLNAFIELVNAGSATLYTDGQGDFWASVNQYDPNTGTELSPAIVDLNVAAVSQATTSLASLQAILAAATVGVHP